MTNAIFEEPWWLEALAPGAWAAVEVTRDGRVVARLPYVRRVRRGIVSLVQPPLTQTLGPWLAPTPGKYSSRLQLEKDWLTELIDALPPYHVFRQSFSPSISNWLPFHWKGFRASVRCTYRLGDLSDPERVWSEFATNARGDVRKAEKQVEVRDDLAFEQFLELHTATYARKGMATPVSDSLLRRLDTAATERSARTLLSAVDADGEVRAAVYIVHDERAAYYLLSGRHPDFQRGGEPTLLVWEAIKRAATTSAVFDFEGSMIESIERFFRSFGARQVPFLRVEATRGRGRAYDIVGGLRR